MSPKNSPWTRGATTLFFAVIAVTGQLSTGCTRFDATPFSSLPTYKIDPFASEVIWQRADGKAVHSDKASIARVEITHDLMKLVENRPNQTKIVPARFRARIVENLQNHYEVKLTFEAGKSYYSGSWESPVFRDGIYGALHNGIHPSRSTLPELDVFDKRRAKVGRGISCIVLGGALFDASSVFFMLLADEQTRSGYLLIPMAIGGAIAGGGIALVISGTKGPSIEKEKNKGAVPFARVGLGSAMVGFDF